MKTKPILGILIPMVTLSFLWLGYQQPNEGKVIDTFNGVKVYYNGGVSNVSGRNVTTDGYNLGLKYQCVEFVKRYYYEFLKHKMPDSYGHAKDFYSKKLKDGSYNKARNLTQFSNPSSSKPKLNDLLIFDGHAFNPFGHVAIISKVNAKSIEIVQQNPGPYSPSRIEISLSTQDGRWKINRDDALGWLRK